MFNTAEDIFLSFLDRVKRTNNPVITRAKFVGLWNDQAINSWIDSMKFTGFELTETQMTDLEPLFVFTDTDYIYGTEQLYPMAPIAANVFPIPKTGTYNGVIIGSDGSTAGVQVEYPKYKRFISVSFKVKYLSGNSCGLTGVSDWIIAHPKKSHLDKFTSKSSFLKPSAKLFYYKLANNNIYVYLADEVEVLGMRLEYLRYPNLMSVENNVFTYTKDLGQDQLESIRDEAVRLYLESVTDPRWQTFSQENAKESQNR